MSLTSLHISLPTAIAAVWVAVACGSRSTTDDAAPVDARSDWACSVSPPVLGAPTVGEVEIVFDAPLDWSVDGDDGAIGVFPAADDGLLIFTERMVHDVDVAGAVISRLHGPIPDGVLRMRSVAAGGNVYGAIVVEVSSLQRDPSTAFCTLSATGQYTASDCVTLGVPFSRPIQIAFDGVHFRLYSVQGDKMHRWTIDVAPTVLVQEDDLWTTTSLDRHTIDAMASGAEESLIATGWDAVTPGCGTLNLHHSDATGYQVQNLLPLDLTLGTTLSTVSDGTMSMLLEAGCLVPDSLECALQSDRTMMFLSTYSLGGASASVVPVAVPPHVAGSVFRDGTATVAVFVTGVNSMVLSRFAADGAVEINYLTLPLASSLAGETTSVFAGRAIGPGDYVITFTTDSPRKRVARFAVIE